MCMNKREFIKSKRKSKRKRKRKIEEFFRKLPNFEKVLLKTTMLEEGKITIRKNDWKILSIIDGEKNIYQILAESPLTFFETLHSIQWLMNKGLIFEKESTTKLMNDKIEGANKLISSIKNKIDWKAIFEETIHEFTLEKTLREAIVVKEEGFSINEDKLFLNTRVIEDFFVEFYDRLFQKMEMEFTPQELNEVIKIIKG